MAPAPIRSIPWRDLTRLTPLDAAAELALPLPWLALSWWLASRGWIAPALGASFMFYLTGLRVVHNGFHRALGLPGWATRVVLLALSALMLGSMHAVQHVHLRHHRFLLEDDDLEGACAKGPAWRALLLGPLYPPRMIVEAWRGSADRAWIAAELAANLVWIPTAGYHVAAMAIGQCLSAFFCVWTVHRGGTSRTSRRRWLNVLAYGMFYHAEHHLFPMVSTRRLPALAARIDAAAPEVREARVL